MTRRRDEAPPDLDARGVRLASDDFERLLTPARSVGGSLRLGRVLLNRATVEGDVLLVDLTIEGQVSLEGSVVDGNVMLFESTMRDVLFGGATVKGGVFLGRANFPPSLSGITIKGSVFLNYSTVGGDVYLQAIELFIYGSQIRGRVCVEGGSIDNDLSLFKSTVEGELSLSSTVRREVSLAESTVKAGVCIALRPEAGIGRVILDNVRVEGNHAPHGRDGQRRCAPQ